MSGTAPVGGRALLFRKQLSATECKPSNRSVYAPIREFMAAFPQFKAADTGVLMVRDAGNREWTTDVKKCYVRDSDVVNVLVLKFQEGFRKFHQFQVGQHLAFERDEAGAVFVKLLAEEQGQQPVLATSSTALDRAPPHSSPAGPLRRQVNAAISSHQLPATVALVGSLMANQTTEDTSSNINAPLGQQDCKSSEQKDLVEQCACLRKRLLDVEQQVTGEKRRRIAVERQLREAKEQLQELNRAHAQLQKDHGLELHGRQKAEQQAQDAMAAMVAEIEELTKTNQELTQQLHQQKQQAANKHD